MDGNLSGETRKRACTSKVRTGCITCKERRVKCDEVKPACLRCRKAGQACKGYSPPRSEPRPPKPDPAIRKLLPRQSTRQPTGLAITIGRALPTVRLQGMDALYFDFFRSEAVKELSGYLPSSFWSRTVLCETLTDPCIRHATLALGAALYPLAAPTQYRPSLIGSHAGPNAHARAAICHHTKTLALFREIMVNGDENFPSRTAFIVTPLLVAFTMLQRNNQAAEALLSGLRALQEVCHVWQGKQARGDPKSPLVNEEMERLTCLMLQIYMLCGHNPLYPTQKGNVFTMPSTMFLDSNPAPDWGDRPVTAISMDSILTIWFSFTSRCLVWLRHTDYTKHSTMPGVYGNACEEQTNLLVRLDRWQQFIYGLNPAPDLDAACLRGLKLIRLQYETLFIWVSEALDRTRMGFDAHTSRFDIIVQGCAELLGHGFRDSEGGAGDFGTLGSYSPAPQTGFTFEGFGVVSMLGFVITRCRIGPVRQRAIGVLERIWWRENGWDTVASYHGARALMELEEQGGIRGEDGDLHIPAESRYYWGNARWENDLPASQKLICTFAQRRPDELGEVVGVTVLMDLSVPRPST